MELEDYLAQYGRQPIRVRRGRRRKGTDWKAVLETQMKAAGLPEPEREYLFHEERR